MITRDGSGVVTRWRRRWRITDRGRRIRGGEIIDIIEIFIVHVGVTTIRKIVVAKSTEIKKIYYRLQQHYRRRGSLMKSQIIIYGYSSNEA